MAATPQKADDLAEVIALAMAESPELRGQAVTVVGEIMDLTLGYVRRSFGPFGNNADRLALTKLFLPAFLKGLRTQEASAGETEARDAHARILSMLREK